MFDPGKFITLYDFLLVPIYLVAIYYIARRQVGKQIENSPFYRYYIPGLFIKIFGALLFTLIYVYYYGGGDTTNYFQSSRAITNLLFVKPFKTFEILSGNHSIEMFQQFNMQTGYPLSGMFTQQVDSFALMRLLVPFNLMGLNFYLPSVCMLAYFSYWGIWRFYSMLCRLYPNITKELAIAVFFIPSVAFWGSGYMKDTITLTATLWCIYNIHQIIVFRKRPLLNLFIFLINVVLIVYLKPYILIALIPAILLMLSFYPIKKIDSIFLKSLVIPLIGAMAFIFAYFIYSSIDSYLRQYGSVESMLVKAQVTQQDLIRGEQYGSHYFDIGYFEPTLGGVLGKMPKAVVAGLYRPFLWEADNIVVLFSALESLILMGLTIFVFIRRGVLRVLNFIFFKEPFLMFAFSFIIIFSFAVGLTAANFGALVRYRIPLMPFLLILLFVCWKCRPNKVEQEEEQ